jgi:hypothetical protein
LDLGGLGSAALTRPVLLLTIEKGLSALALSPKESLLINR